jgi:hypothetical protein
MNVLLENGYVVGYATVGNIVGSIDIPDFESEEEFNKFSENPNAYRLSDNGSLELDTDKLAKILDEHEVEMLRLKREQECFTVINRGRLWYSHLTDEQLVELDDWYQAWLDVTETRIIPNMPVWID